MNCERAARVLAELHYFYPNREKAEAVELAIETLARAGEIERIYGAPVLTVIRALAAYRDEDEAIAIV